MACLWQTTCREVIHLLWTYEVDARRYISKLEEVSSIPSYSRAQNCFIQLNYHATHESTSCSPCKKKPFTAPKLLTPLSNVWNAFYHCIECCCEVTSVIAISGLQAEIGFISLVPTPRWDWHSVVHSHYPILHPFHLSSTPRHSHLRLRL